MAMKTLTYKTIGEIDGGVVAIAVDSELKRVIADCRDREGESKPRKVMIELLISPVTDQYGHADDVEMQFTIKSALPSRRTIAYTMGIRRDNTVFFQEDSLENPSQNTLSYSSDDESDDE